MNETEQSPLAALSSSIVGLVARAAPSVVSVRSHRSTCSGFVWRPGLVITAEEALAEDGEIEVTLPGGAGIAARVIGRDPSSDVALLSVNVHAGPSLALERVAPSAGALAVVVGAREGEPVAAMGIVARSGPAWTSVRGGRIDLGLDLDASIRTSSQGGLALDVGGRAFGMAVFGPRRRVLVIPTETIDRVAALLEARGGVPRGYLGLALQPVRLDGPDESWGAMVASVDARGPGALAGFRQGDVLTGWDGTPIVDARHLLRALGPDSVGRDVRVSLVRAGEPRELTLRIGERPTR